MDGLDPSAMMLHPHAECPPLPRGDLWIFAYGSLMWNPGFSYVESSSALLRGYHRSFCIWSARYRGTPERPGLVLGLDRGGACRGIAYRVAEAQVGDVLSVLWAREMPRLTYQPRVVKIAMNRARIDALTFIANPRRESYAGRMSVEQAAERIACCAGIRGPNLEYLANTLAHLQALGVHDPHLSRIYDMVRARTGQ
ncbi:MAG: gamma-glutamylcyclotransferase [Rhodospirillaceae bacterium]